MSIPADVVERRILTWQSLVRVFDVKNHCRYIGLLYASCLCDLPLWLCHLLYETKAKVKSAESQGLSQGLSIIREEYWTRCMKVEGLGESLLRKLEEVPDPRSGHGRRHLLSAILALSVCAMASGTRSLYAIAQWGRMQNPATLKTLGFTRDRTPAVSTLHKGSGSSQSWDRRRRQ